MLDAVFEMVLRWQIAFSELVTYALVGYETAQATWRTSFVSNCLQGLDEVLFGSKWRSPCLGWRLGLLKHRSSFLNRSTFSRSQVNAEIATVHVFICELLRSCEVGVGRDSRARRKRCLVIGSDGQKVVVVNSTQPGGIRFFVFVVFGIRCALILLIVRSHSSDLTRQTSRTLLAETGSSWDRELKALGFVLARLVARTAQVLAVLIATVLPK